VDVEVPDEAPSSRVGAKRLSHEPRLGRDAVASMAPLTGSAATDASPPADGVQQPGRLSSPNIPAAAFTADALYKRGKVMLTGEGERPAASGDLRTAVTATLELILTVCVAAERLWTEHEEAIRRCCGPSMPKGLIDGREVFAYLLADVLGRPPLHPDDAHGVAQSRANAVAKARALTGGQKTPTAAHAAAVRIAARAAADGAPPAAVAAYRKLLEPYALKLPACTVGRRMRLAEAEAAPMPTPVAAAAAATAAEVAAAEEVAPADAMSLLAEREKAERSAQAAAATAAETLRADEARVERAQRRLSVLGPRPIKAAWQQTQPDATGYLKPPYDYAAWHAAMDARWAKVIAPFKHAEAAVEAAEAEAMTSRTAHRESLAAHGESLSALLAAQDAAWEAAVQAAAEARAAAAEARAAAAAAAAEARAYRAEAVRLQEELRRCEAA
jgi:hypothetical protein